MIGKPEFGLDRRLQVSEPIEPHRVLSREYRLSGESEA